LIQEVVAIISEERDNPPINPNRIRVRFELSYRNNPDKTGSKIENKNPKRPIKYQCFSLRSQAKNSGITKDNPA
jgi:hypothetical protein